MTDEQTAVRLIYDVKLACTRGFTYEQICAMVREVFKGTVNLSGANQVAGGNDESNTG